jgi:threonine synthase
MIKLTCGNDLLGSVFRRFVVLPTANVGLGLGIFKAIGAGLAVNPLQKRPSLRKTSTDGMLRERKPINLQL